MNVQENQHLHSDDWQRTIYIDTLDVETIDFDLTDEKRMPWCNQASTGRRLIFAGLKTQQRLQPIGFLNNPVFATSHYQPGYGG